MPTFPSVTASLALINLLCATYHIWMIYRAYKSEDVPFEMYMEARREVLALESKLYAAAACDAPFNYVWITVLDEAKFIVLQEWLNGQDGSRFAVEIHDTLDHYYVKLSTSDKQFAMLFKLTFGGAA